MRGLLFLTFIFCHVNCLFAKTSDTSYNHNQLQDVVVTGTRTPRLVATLPLNVTVLSEEQIRASGMSRLNEVLQEQAGLVLTPIHGNAGGEGIQVQGLDAAYTMILIDGQPLIGRTAGGLDLSRVTLANIERIEIVKGASSCLYGSEALGGVINIITKKLKGKERFDASVFYKVQTNHTHDASLNAQLIRSKVRLGLSANFFISKGYTLNQKSKIPTVAPYNNLTIQPELHWDITDAISLGVNFRTYQQQQKKYGYLNDEQLKGASTIDEVNTAISIKQKINPSLKLDYDFYITNYKAKEHLAYPNGNNYYQSNYNQWYWKPEVRLQYNYNKNVMLIGIGATTEKLDRTLFKNAANLQSQYLLGQYEWHIHKKLNTVVGFRYDHHHQYKSQFSPKLSANYNVNANFSLIGSVGNGYKAPDMRQLYLDFTNSTVGYTVLGRNVVQRRIKDLMDAQEILTYDTTYNFDKPLLPERGTNYNIGVRYKSPKVKTELNFFYNSISDLIDVKAVAKKKNGQNVFSYINVDKIFTSGVEYKGQYDLNSNINFWGGFQYLIAKDQSVLDKINGAGIYARDPITLKSFKLKGSDYMGLFNRSRHIVNVGVGFSVPRYRLKTRAALIYRSSYGLFDGNSNGVLDKYDTMVEGFALVNLSATKKLFEALEIQVGAKNLLNYKNIEMVSNIPGRLLFARVSYNFTQ